MFRTKRDVDRHVQDVMRKLKNENEVSSAILDFVPKFQFHIDFSEYLVVTCYEEHSFVYELMSVRNICHTYQSTLCKSVRSMTPVLQAKDVILRKCTQFLKIFLFCKILTKAVLYRSAAEVCEWNFLFLGDSFH